MLCEAELYILGDCIYAPIANTNETKPILSYYKKGQHKTAEDTFCCPKGPYMKLLHALNQPFKPLVPRHQRRGRLLQEEAIAEAQDESHQEHGSASTRQGWVFGVVVARLPRQTGLHTMRFAARIFALEGWPIGATHDLKLPLPPIDVETHDEQQVPKDARKSWAPERAMTIANLSQAHKVTMKKHH